MNLKALLIVASLGLSAGLVSCATETTTPTATPIVTTPAVKPAAMKSDAAKPDAMKPADATKKPQ